MSTDRDGGRSIVEGAVAGVAAWIVGYAITYLLVAPAVRHSALQRIVQALGGTPATYEMVGWVFYNAHFVDTVFRGIPVVGSTTTTYVGDGGFTPALYLLPAALLFVAGLALARRRGASDASDGALTGATTLPGYALASIAGAFLFRVAVGGASGAPDLLPAVFLAGIVYPAIFGGAGGLVGGLLVDETARSTPESDSTR
ncbi:MAG: hypothetical protein ABEJ28_08390 [Salinigranum sp.]